MTAVHITHVQMHFLYIYHMVANLLKVFSAASSGLCWCVKSGVILSPPCFVINNIVWNFNHSYCFMKLVFIVDVLS